MEENIRIDTTDDRISQLPEFIVHRILSFLDSPLHLVRMSVLSRNWFALTASFPILKFLSCDFKGSSFLGSVRDNFYKYMNYITSRFCEQNISARAFMLCAELHTPTEVDIIDRCVELILKKGVQVLLIDIYAWERYRVPDILLSASSLRSLTLRRCDLPSSLMVDAVKFTSLKKLDLLDICIGEEVIKYLTTSCPLLEEFKVARCYGFKIFGVYGLQNLRRVWIFFKREVERIDIEASNLCYLGLMDWEGRGPPSMNLVSCKKLTEFSYIGYSPKSKVFTDFLSNSPFIKKLFLQLPNNFNNLKLSSCSVRRFEQDSQFALKEFYIDVPWLLLEYNDQSDRPAPMLRDSAMLKTRMECCPIDDVDTLWFQKLRRFLDKTNQFDVLNLRISTNFIDVEELKVIQSPPYKLEHVELQLNTINELSVYVAVVDAVFWCCRPRSLTLRSSFPNIGFEERSNVVKFTYMKLVQQEDEGQSNIQMVLSSSSKDKNHFSNLNSLLTALPHVQQRLTITFTEEEGNRIMDQGIELTSEDKSMKIAGY